MTLAIARALGVDDDVAEQMKRGEESPLLNLVASSRPDPGAASSEDKPSIPAADQVRQVAMQRASSFVDEIRSSLEFYTAQSQGARIARVLVTGGGSKLVGFLDLLGQRIPVPVEAGRVFQRIRSDLPLSGEVQTEAEPVLAVAVGLAIPGRHA